MTTQQFAPIQKVVTLVESNGTATVYFFNWLMLLYNMLKPGITVTVPVAKLTGGGSNGSLTYKNGILTAAVPPT